MKKILSIISLLCLCACTDAGFDKMTSFGSSRKIDCYSGGKLIYSGESTGKISSEENSDGYYFREKASGKLMEVSGNCILTTVE